jgi:IS30 family transposase
MTASKRTRLSASQRVEVWRRWKAGESLHAIGRALGKAHPVIHLLLKRHGGIAPLVRRRSRTALSSRHSRDSGHHSGQIVDAISIRERPAEVEDRAVPGHWEGDLLGGAHNSHVATLVERRSRFVMLVKIPSKDTATVVAALSQHVRQLPSTLRRSLTWDRGLEMAQHQSFTVATDVKVYFCDPQSPWQRGSNENTNGLLRQYLPKKADLSSYSQSDLDQIALRLNQRPRKTLGFETPESRLQASVASTS